MKSTILAVAALLFLLAAPAPGASEAADVVFLNGRVYTMETAWPWAEAVAVRDDRIVFVGASAAAGKLIGTATRTIDLHGRMLMPGFVDGHNHILCGAAGKRGVRLVGCKDKREALDRIQQYVRENPDNPRYLGYGWQFEMFEGDDITRRDLDAICADRPVLIFNEDNHHAWFNTLAMQRANISRDTPDPVAGACYSREADGTPHGLALEPATWQPIALANRYFGGKEMLADVVAEILPVVSRSGITSVHDMGVWAPDLPDGWKGFELLLELERAGRLPCRVVGTYATRAVNDAPQNHVARLAEWADKYHSNKVQIRGLKLWADGTFLSHTGVQLEPYADRPEICGESAWTTELLAGWIEAAHTAGFDVEIHVDGDATVRRVLDAISQVQQAHGSLGRRHVLHHSGLIHPDDAPRLRALGVGLNATPVWMVDYKGQYALAQRILGAARVAREFHVHRALMENGVNVSFGSDLPGTDPEEISPLLQIQAAVTGHMPGQKSSVMPPVHRRPTLAQMLRGYTMGGAWQMRLENEIGSIRVGKKADIIVLERNLFAIPAEEIAAVKIALTMCDGRVVYESR